MNAAIDLQVLDDYTQRTTPVVMVPHAKPVEDLAEPGHRFLAAKDGMHVQFRRAWCSGSVLVAESKVAMPFGALAHFPRDTSLTLNCGRIPASLARAFFERAKAESPVEIAAWITWSESSATGTDGPWRLRWLETIDASGSHVHFHRPQLDANEHLVLDVHSHGKHSAYFSSTDDRDDADISVVKLAAVFGCVDSDVQYALRLCAGGTFQHIGELNDLLDASC